MEFWFEFASTYSYLAAMRIQRLASDASVEIAWRPFLLGPIFKKQLGYADSPFNRQPARGKHMWRDVERLTAKYGLKFKKPSTFPRNALTAARVALIGEDQPWIGQFVKAVYHANFVEDRDISSDKVVEDILLSQDLPAKLLMAKAAESATKKALTERTELAFSKGIFGAPNFFIGEEHFFGNDRLEDALLWAIQARRAKS